MRGFRPLALGVALPSLILGTARLEAVPTGEALSAGQGAAIVRDVETGIAGFVGMAATGPLDEAVRVESLAGYTAVFGGSTDDLPRPHLARSVEAYFANTGKPLYVVRVAAADDAALIGVDGGPGARTGLQALREVDEISAVAVPGVSSTPVQIALLQLGESMGDRIALLDPAADDDVGSVLTRRARLVTDAGFGALYFPWVRTGTSGTLVPPSAFAAGVLGRTAPGDAPVGVLAGATGVAVSVSDQEQGRLNPEGINAIRRFGDGSVRIWGARTLASDPSWTYLSVRRMASHLSESIREATTWVVLETNDAALWARLQAAVETFLDGHFRAGWFPGTKAEDAYFVRCDRSVMTQDDLDAGRTVVQMGFAPMRPGEFVVQRIVYERSP